VVERAVLINIALRIILVPIAVLALWSYAVAAPERSSFTGDDLMDLSLEVAVRRGDKLEQVRARMWIIYGSYDYDGGGISATDYQIG
jgi:hypothetical protein